MNLCMKCQKPIIGSKFKKDHEDKDGLVWHFDCNETLEYDSQKNIAELIDRCETMLKCPNSHCAICKEDIRSCLRKINKLPF